MLLKAGGICDSYYSEPLFELLYAFSSSEANIFIHSIVLSSPTIEVTVKENEIPLFSNLINQLIDFDFSGFTEYPKNGEIVKLGINPNVPSMLSYEFIRSIKINQFNTVLTIELKKFLYLNISKTSVTVNTVDLKNIYGPINIIITKLSYKFVFSFLPIILILIGSLDAIGNPTSLIRSISVAISRIYNETINFNNNPIVSVINGIEIFGTEIWNGLLGSLGGFSSSWSRNISAILNSVGIATPIEGALDSISVFSERLKTNNLEITKEVENQIHPLENYSFIPFLKKQMYILCFLIEFTLQFS